MIQKTNSMTQECSYQVLLIASRENSSPVVLQQIYCSNVSDSIEYFLFLQLLAKIDNYNSQRKSSAWCYKFFFWQVKTTAQGYIDKIKYRTLY